MSKVRGMGGWFVVDSGVPLGGGEKGNYTYLAHNAEYEAVTTVDLREYRSTGCGGWSEGLPRFRRLDHVRFSVAEDEINYPQVLGFTEGAEISFYLKRGELDEFDYVYRSIVQSVRALNDQQKARVCEIICKLGRYLRGVPSPDTGLPPLGQPPIVQTPYPLPTQPGWNDTDQTGLGAQYSQQQQLLGQLGANQ